MRFIEELWSHINQHTRPKSWINSDLHPAAGQQTRLDADSRWDFYPRHPNWRDNALINRLEVSIVTFQIVFAVTVGLTVLSGLAATSIVVFGDTRRNVGQRNVAEKLAQIAVLGTTAIASLLALWGNLAQCPALCCAPRSYA